MEIEQTFLSLEEIKETLTDMGLTFRISFDGDETKNEPETAEKWEPTDFATDADPAEIKKWETELADTGEEEEREEENFETGEKQSPEEFKETEEADVVYFDVFKKKTYEKTFIFQKEGENEREIYRLVGFCEAPMS